MHIIIIIYIGECIPLTPTCQEYSLEIPRFLPWITSDSGTGITPCDNPVGTAVIVTNMTSKLFARSNGTLIQICVRETVQRLIEQCLIFIDESDVLYTTMACRPQGYYLYYRSKLIVPSSTVTARELNNVTSDSDSVSSAFTSSVSKLLHGI